MSSNNNSWEIFQMSNRPLQAQQRRFLRRRTTTTPQQTSNLQRYYRLPIMGAYRPSIMVPVLRRGTGSHRLNNNRIFAVTPQGGLPSGHGGSQQASRRLPHQFVITALTIRRRSQNDLAAVSTYGRIRAANLPPSPA
ncbi:hypothetical protein K1719_005749 [Acacia pycnantha]|nr:hypothetical protein K1719_005749 [Acacia pycnantha]